QTGTAPDEQTEMRYPTRASELVDRRLQVPSSPLHDPQRNPTSRPSAGRGIIASVVLDLGHQRSRSRGAGTTSSRSAWNSLDQLMSLCDEERGHFETKRLGGLEIDHSSNFVGCSTGTTLRQLLRRNEALGARSVEGQERTFSLECPGARPSGMSDLQISLFIATAHV